MAAITMCPGVPCPLKETCHRYTAQPNPHWQSYADYTTTLYQGDVEMKCLMYVPTTKIEGMTHENISNS